MKQNCQIDIPREFLSFAQQKWCDVQRSGIVPNTVPIPNAGFFLACMCPDGTDVFGARVELRNATVEPQTVGNMQIGGGFEVVSRLLYGYDQGLTTVMVAAGIDLVKFEAAAQPFRAIPPLNTLPLRDAIDFVHFLVYSAIKLHRYRGATAPIGGAIEIASVTPDRGFRWVLHKPLQESIGIPRGSGSP